MTWVASRAFVGVVAWAEKSFAAGDQITDAEAKELGIKGKPDLAQLKKTKDANGTQTQKA